MEVLIAKKFNLRIALHNKSEGKRKELSEEEEEGIESSLEGSDITHKTPGRRDTVYVGMDCGKREHKQKQYLLWKLGDLPKIISGSSSMSSPFYKYATS